MNKPTKSLCFIAILSYEISRLHNIGSQNNRIKLKTDAEKLNTNKKFGRRVRPTLYAPAGL